MRPAWSTFLLTANSSYFRAFDSFRRRATRAARRSSSWRPARPVVIAGDLAVSFGELDEPKTEGQLLVRALDPELVWLAHTHEPWRPASFH